MIGAIIHQYDFNMHYAAQLVADLSEEQMTTAASGGLINHPAFTLGHLVSGSAMIAEDLGGTMQMPPGWEELFLRKGPGDPRTPDIDVLKYPPKDALLLELKSQHEKVKSLLQNISSEELAAPVQWRFSRFMPSLLDVVTFMCINHEAMHLGQLAGWRREMGLPSALAML